MGPQQEGSSIGPLLTIENAENSGASRAGDGETHQADEWDLDARRAVVKEALVKDGKQRVEDGGVGLEHLVNEGHLCAGQVPIYLPDVLVLFQGPHAQRPKQFLQRDTKLAPRQIGW